MKYIIILLMVCSLWSPAQEDISLVDTTGLKYSEELYFYDLTIKETENKNIVSLEWKENRKVKAMIIELRDLKTKELFNREKYYSSTANLPAAAAYTLYPISYNEKGEAVTTTLARFKANKSEPIQTKSYKNVLETLDKQRKQRELKKQQLADGVFSYIDTTTYQFSNKLYFHDLTLVASQNEGKVVLSWNTQPNVKFLMIELRDLKTKKLFYRDKFYTSTAELPTAAEYTVYPVYYNQKGEAVTTTLADFKANNSRALSPKSYFAAKEKERQYELRKERRAEEKAAGQRQRETANNERSYRITPRVLILTFIVIFLAGIIVIGVWIVGKLTRHKDPKANAHQQNSGGWE